MNLREDLGALAGTALLLATGFALFLSSVPLLRDSLRDEPVAMSCEKWRALTSRPKWVFLSDCPLDAANRWPAPGGGSWVAVVADAQPVRLVLELKQAPASARVNVGGLVVPAPQELRALAWQNTAVLREGEAPPRLRVLGAALLGFMAMIWAFVPLVRRIAAEREL